MTSPLVIRLTFDTSILALRCRAGYGPLRVGEVPFIRYAGYLLKFYLDRRNAAEERSFADKRRGTGDCAQIGGCDIITRHGKPAGVLIGFETEDDWFDYRLENDSRFLQRVEQARRSLRAGRGVKLEDVK